VAKCPTPSANYRVIRPPKRHGNFYPIVNFYVIVSWAPNQETIPGGRDTNFPFGESISKPAPDTNAAINWKK
jgi:hypothetical protein